MTITRDARMKQQQWSSGDDAPSRVGFNADAQFLFERAAYDDGTTGAVLPVTDVVSGRYFRQSFADGYALHRVQGSTWEWVGGSIAPTRLRYRRALAGDVAWSTDVAGVDAATMTAGGELGTAGLVRSVAGGSAGADLATDLSMPSATGRWFVRTRATSERGVVAAAHDNAAGPLFSAREVGGTYPWTVDSRGRMRSQAPAAFGAAGLTDNVPLVSAPSGTDVTALDLYGEVTGAIPALRMFRDNSDVATPIAVFLPDAITLGRSSWAGASINLRAPALNLFGAVDVTGSVDIDNDLTVGDDLTVTDQITAEGGKVATYDSGSNFGITSQIALSAGTGTRDLRHDLVWRKRLINLAQSITPTTAFDINTFTFVPRTTCNIELNLGCHITAIGPGSSGADLEPTSVMFRLRILANDDTVLFTGDEIYRLTVFGSNRFDLTTRAQVTVADCPSLQLTAGTTYKIQLWGRRDPTSTISTVLEHIIGTIREVALIGT